MVLVVRNVNSLLLSVFFLIVVSGCGGGSSGDRFTGARGQVSGTVTLDGQPLKSGCQVIFISTKGGHTAAGVVGGKGAYTLVYKDKKGLPAVEYQVQLTAPVVVASTQSVDPTKMAEKMKLSSKSQGEDGDSPFPLKYGSTTTSKLTHTVKAGPNTADLKLEKK